MSTIHIPDQKEIEQAAERIRPYANRTPVMTCRTLNRMVDAELFFKCENFQKVGAFKFRGAANAVFSLDEKDAEKGVCTHSSGNHAQALALAAALRGIPSHIIMPENASPVKIEGVKGYGGNVALCKPTLQAREDTTAEIQKQTGALFIHPFNDTRIIAGQGTATLELLDEISDPDLVMAPVGGGGLLSGTALAAHYRNSGIKIIAAEPGEADDAYRSFKSGQFIPSENPTTIADGLLTSLGDITFPIIQEYVDDIVTVTEANIVKAMKLIWERMKIIVEPSSAVPFGAMLENNQPFKGKKIGIILSGGNVDLASLPW